MTLFAAWLGLPCCGYGFRAQPCGLPRNDGGVDLPRGESVCAIPRIHRPPLRDEAPKSPASKHYFLKLLRPLGAIQPPAQEHFYLRKPESMYFFPRPVPDPEGRFAIVTNVGRGMRWTWRSRRRTWLTRTAKSCGPDAPMLASSCAGSFRRSDGGKKARSPGRARSKS
jgi:hypothetical protein